MTKSKRKSKPKTHLPARNVTHMSEMAFAKHRAGHLKFQIERLQAAQVDYTKIREQFGRLEPQRPYVVASEGVFIYFAPVGDKGGAIPTAVRIEEASRFEKDIADRFAHNLTQASHLQTGNPQTFEAVHLFDALDQTIKGHEEAVATLQKEVDNIEKSLSTIH